MRRVSVRQLRACTPRHGCTVCRHHNATSRRRGKGHAFVFCVLCSVFGVCLVCVWCVFGVRLVGVFDVCLVGVFGRCVWSVCLACLVCTLCSVCSVCLALWVDLWQPVDVCLFLQTGNVTPDDASVEGVVQLAAPNKICMSQHSDYTVRG